MDSIHGDDATTMKQHNQPVTLRKDVKLEDLYDVQDELGKGRFGKVYRCLEKSSGKSWAGKFIKAIKQKDKESVRKEISIMNQLNHSNLLRCIDAFEAGSQMVMIMEMVSGGELFERVIGEDFPLSEGDVILFMRQICEGVQHMHDNHILHLDLKPENVMCVDKKGHRIKLIDFGLSRRFHDNDDVKVMFGTPEFVAPEIVNYEQIGFATDMWSVGVICYVLLSGLSPFMGDSAADTLNNVTAAEWDFEDEAFDTISEDAKDFIEQLLERRKEKRMSVHCCLEHNWLRCNSEDFTSNKLCKERLRKFVARRRWQKTANAVRAIGRMTALRLFSNLKKSGALGGGGVVGKQEITSVSSSTNDRVEGSKTEVDTAAVNTLPNSNKVSEFPFASDVDTSAEVTKAAKAIQSAFRRNRPTKPIELTSTTTTTTETINVKTVTFSEVDDTGRNIASDSSVDIDKTSDEESETSDVMDIDSTCTLPAGKPDADGRNHRSSKKVILKPPEIDRALRDCEVCEGSAARFDCRVTGFPEPEIYWFKDGKAVEPNRRFRVEFEEDDVCSLVILEVEPDDDGRYTCEARNCAGGVSCSAELLVEVLNAGDESTEESEAEESLATRTKSFSSTTSSHSVNSTYEKIFIGRLPSSSSTAIKPSLPASTAATSAYPSSSAATSTYPVSTAAKSSLKVQLATVNTSKRGTGGPKTPVPLKSSASGEIRGSAAVGGKNTEHSPLRPAVSYNVSESRQNTSRQVQGTAPAERKTTGNAALLKTHDRSSNGVVIATTPQQTKSAPSKTVTESQKVYVKDSNSTPRKTNIISKPRTSGSNSSAKTKSTSSIEIPRTANAKIQDAVNRLKRKTAAVDEPDRSRTSSRSMIRGGQGIGALTARFESPKETKPERTTRREPIITSKVSDRKEIFNNNNGSPSSSRSSSSSSSSRVPLKNTPSRSVMERYTSPGKSASLKSKFEAKPEADRQPQFLRKLQGQSVSEGESVKFSCKPSGVPVPSITWQFKGKTLKDEGRIEIYGEKDLHYLEIFDLSTEDAGTYTCKLLNSTGRASSSADLKVNANLRKSTSMTKERAIPDKAPVFDRKLDDIEVNEGDEAKLECAISGHPAPEITWLYEGKPITECKRRRIVRNNHDNTCALIIANVVEDDDAVYTCTAKNRGGSVSCTAEVIVELKPSPRVEPKKVETPENVDKTSQSVDTTSQRVDKTSKGVGKMQLSVEKAITVETSKTLETSRKFETNITLDTAKTFETSKTIDTSKRFEKSKTLEASKKFENTSKTLEASKKFETSSRTLEASKKFEPSSKTLEASKKFETSSRTLEASRKFETSSRTLEASKKFETSSTPLKASKRFETSSTPLEASKKFETSSKTIEVSKKFEVSPKRDPYIKTESSVRTSPFRTKDKKMNESERGETDKLLNNNDIKNDAMIINRNGSSTRTSPATSTSSSLSSSPSPSPSKSLSQRPVPKTPKLPEFLVRIRSQTVTEPRAARFSCLVKGIPKPTVTWTKEGEPVHDDGRVQLTEDNGEHKLDITETNTLDSGKYTCTLSNDAGNASASANLTVNAQYSRDVAPKFLQNLEEIKIKDGESAKFSCKINSASPNPTLQWLFKGKEIPPNDDIYDISFDGSTATLSLSDVLPEDEGEYTCSVRNSKGSCACSARLIVQVDAKSPPPSSLSPRSLKSETPVSSEPETLPDTDTSLPTTDDQPAPEITPADSDTTTKQQEPLIKDVINAESEYCQCPTTVFTFPDVKDTTDGPQRKISVDTKDGLSKADSAGLPEFVTRLQDMEVVDGSPVILSVKVKGNPLPDVMWIFDECEILEDDDFKLVQDGDSFSLEIREVYPEDAGEYVCRLIGDNDVEVECAAQLHVKDPDGAPAKFVNKPRSINVDEGNSVKLSCKIEGDPEPSVTWFKDDEEIKTDERILIGMSSVGGLNTLEIAAVLVTDAGNYTCTIKNELGEESCTVAVRVQQLLEEQTDFRSLLKSRPKLQKIQSPPSTDRQPKKPTPEPEVEQLDFRHVLTRHVQTKKKPLFMNQLGNLFVREGDEAVFECYVEGLPEPAISWAVGSNPIKESKYFQMSYDGKLARLTITEAFPEDDGEYKCTASNAAGTSSVSAAMKVSPYEDGDDDDMQYNTNNSNSSNGIHLNGDVTHNIVTSHKTTSRDSSRDEPDYPSDNDGPTLQPKEITPPVSPPLSPCATSIDKSESEVTEHEIQAEVTQQEESSVAPSTNDYLERQRMVNGDLLAATEPLFEVELRDEPIIEGSAARLQGRVLGDPEPDILWYKDGQEIHEGRKYRFEFEDDDVVALLINNATMNDLGCYTCKAINRAGKAESSAQLIAEETVSPKVEGGPTNLQVVVGQTLNISCKISGKPTPEVTWYKDRKELLENDRIHIDSSANSASLVITNANELDAGRYKLCLESHCGRDTFAISVSVVDKPEPPAGKPIASNVSRDALTLSWSGAAYDGGSRITGYIVESCKTGDQKWGRVTRTTSTSHVIRDLESDTEFLFRVSAENAHGVSDPGDITEPILTVDDGDDVFSDGKHQDSDGKKSSNKRTHSPPCVPHKPTRNHGAGNTGGNASPRDHLTREDGGVKTSSSRETSYDNAPTGGTADQIQSVKDAQNIDELCRKLSSLADDQNAADEEAPISSGNDYLDETEDEVAPVHVTIKTDTEMSKFYELKEQIGKGRFGVVYRCVSKTSGKTLAAKFIKSTPKEMAAVRDEIAMMNELHHPKLLQCVDAFEMPRQMIVILEMIAGGELFERVIDDDFILTERDVIKYMRQICAGVQHMHQQSILHLDLKPENIMCVDKTGSRIKLIDFGLARKFNPKDNVKVMFGTPEFVAPEVINYEKINFGTDMWSVGVICYILLSGLSPFMGDNDAETLTNVTLAEWDFDDEAFDDISDDSKEFIESLLVKDLPKRNSVAECLQDKWLIKDTNKMKACKISKDNFKKFVARRRWQKTATAVRALGRMASLTMFGNLKKLNGNATSSTSNGSEKDKTPFSALLRQKREEEAAKKAEGLKGDDAEKAQSGKASPPPTTPKPQNPLRSTRENNIIADDKSTPDKKITSSDSKITSSNIKISSSISKITSSYSKSSSSINSNVTATNPSQDRLNGTETINGDVQKENSKVVAPAFIKEMVDCEVFEGDCARFDCKIIGEPEPDVTWLQDGMKVEESKRFIFDYYDDGSCSLIIKKCVEDDDAEYTFKASNSAGEITCTAELIVDVL